jgi:hypothetical protein
VSHWPENGNPIDPQYLSPYYLSMTDIDVAQGRRVLAQQRKTWDTFIEAVRRVTGGEHA